MGVFPFLWKEAVVVPVFKKGSSALVTNCRSISLLNNFSKVFKIIIHDQLSYYFKSKLHPSQHGFIKSKSTNQSDHLFKQSNALCLLARADGRYLL
jgi:hypothetical protein